jgi:DNA repair protein RecO (recombination protein O)
MDWSDEGIVLSARAHGEHAAVVTLLTASHGRHAGLVSGGQGRSAKPTLQSGNRVKAAWRARLPEHLGNYTLDLDISHSSAWLDSPEILNIIASACVVTESGLPERQPVPGIFASLATLFSLSDADLWGPAYVKWEMGLLQTLGYGLDLSQCAASGKSDDLAYVSPRTGRAVSVTAGEPYRDKLLRLPSFLIGSGEWTEADILSGLVLTGHFLSTHVFAHPHNRLLIQIPGDMPQARHRLVDYYLRSSEKLAIEVA